MVPQKAARPRIAAIIPSLNGDATVLQEALEAQTWRPDEIAVIRGVQPSGQARNLGASVTEGDILLFIDDDARPGRPDLVESMVRPLLEDPQLGVTGAARVLPGNAPWFQRRVAAEIPRTVNAVPGSPLETNPPLQGYGHSLITTTCAAMSRHVFEEAGRFSEDLVRGVDTDLFYRIRNRGYRFVMVPEVYVEHPAPDGVGALWHKFYWYGVGYAQETRRRPQQEMGPRLQRWWQQLAFLLAATAWLLPNVFILYSFSHPYWSLGFRPLKALSTYAVAWGYVRGWRQAYAAPAGS